MPAAQGKARTSSSGLMQRNCPKALVLYNCRVSPWPRALAPCSSGPGRIHSPLCRARPSAVLKYGRVQRCQHRLRCYSHLKSPWPALCAWPLRAHADPSVRPLSRGGLCVGTMDITAFYMSPASAVHASMHVATSPTTTTPVSPSISRSFPLLTSPTPPPVLYLKHRTVLLKWVCNNIKSCIAAMGQATLANDERYPLCSPYWEIVSA